MLLAVHLNNLPYWGRFPAEWKKEALQYFYARLLQAGLRLDKKDAYCAQKLNSNRKPKIRKNPMTITILSKNKTRISRAYNGTSPARARKIKNLIKETGKHPIVAVRLGDLRSKQGRKMVRQLLAA